MLLKAVTATIASLSLLLAPAMSIAASRGPSTPEERKQALENIRAWQGDPLGPKAKDQFGAVLRLLAEVPDLTVHVCTLLDKLPKGEKKDASVIFGGEFMAQAVFVLDNAGKPDDLQAEYLAGVEGALHTYELLLTTNPKDRQPYLDDLIQRRNAGTLAQFVHERAAASCH